MTRRLSYSALVLAVGLLLAGCGGRAPEEPETEIELLPGHVVVEMIGLRFVPSHIEVEPGTQVVFVNADRMPHNVVHGEPRSSTAAEPLFQSPILRAGQKWAYVFEEEGEYPFMCTVAGHHLQGMVGKVTVRRK